MAIDNRTEVILKLAQTINPQVDPERTITIDLPTLRQLPDGTLGREVARFLDDHGFSVLDSGDWVQRTHDIWHVLTGLSPSEHDELMLQAFTRAQVFRPSSTLLVVTGLLMHKANFKDVIKGFREGRLANRLVDWNPADDWATPLNEVRQKLGIQLLEVE
jgi:ubiquinone biosynthesis protein Coq4